MSFKRTNYAYELPCQVWFQRVYCARGFLWSVSVVLHGSWWWGGVFWGDRPVTGR